MYSKQQKHRDRGDNNHVNIQYLGEIILLDDNNKSKRKKDEFDKKKRDKREKKNKELKVQAHEEFFVKVYGAGSKQMQLDY